MDHERAIGRHGLGNAFPIRLLEGRVERQNLVMDLGVDGVAEFDNERRLSGGQIAWLVRICQPGPLQTGAKGARAIPASSRQARTAFAMATAFGLSP